MVRDQRVRVDQIQLIRDQEQDALDTVLQALGDAAVTRENQLIVVKACRDTVQARAALDIAIDNVVHKPSKKLVHLNITDEFRK